MSGSFPRQSAHRSFRPREARRRPRLFGRPKTVAHAILHHEDGSVKHDACNKKIQRHFKRKEHLVDDHDLPLFRTLRRRECRQHKTTMDRTSRNRDRIATRQSGRCRLIPFLSTICAQIAWMDASHAHLFVARVVGKTQCQARDCVDWT